MTRTLRRRLQNGDYKEEKAHETDYTVQAGLELDEQTAVVQLQTIEGERIIIGGGEGGRDRETPSTRFCINVYTTNEMGGGRVYLQLWITPTQIASIVKQFFSELVRDKPFYEGMLRRMLRKRWATMTSSLYRDKNFPFIGASAVKPYDNPRDY